MANSLGERIKKLRKELKMTQTDLAGKEMTKSMLSQIENDLAMPSMKNLQYLASRLGKPASYFLEDSTYQNALPVEKINGELREVTSLISNNKLQDALSKLEDMSKKYNIDHDSKLYADFLNKYGGCLIDLNFLEEGEKKINEAVNIYNNKFLFIDAARSYLSLIGVPWSSFDYDKCLNILMEAVSIYNNSISKDYAFEIEILYIKSLVYAGLDRLEDSITTTVEALNISKETKIYYRSDELYKNMAAMNVFMGNFKDFDEYMDKARQFAVFTENNSVLSSIEGICGMYRNQLREPEKAIEYLREASKLSTGIAAFAYTEQAKSYYIMEDFQQALDNIKLVQYPNYTPFKYDYLHIWSSKTYEGLCLNKLGRSGEAIQAIMKGIEKMEIVKESKTLSFAYKSLSEVYSDAGDFENAFAALKRANEIEEIAKTNKLYY